MIELWSAIQDMLQAVYVPRIYVNKGVCAEVEVALFSRLPLIESGIELKNDLVSGLQKDLLCNSPQSRQGPP